MVPIMKTQESPSKLQNKDEKQQKKNHPQTPIVDFDQSF